MEMRSSSTVKGGVHYHPFVTPGTEAEEIVFRRLPDGTTERRVRIPTRGHSLAALLYVPAAGPRRDEGLPTVVVSPNGGGVKEQAAGLYARRLAARGFVTVTFDPSHQGESGGEPRLEENPDDRVEDISAAVDWLTQLACVDPERIGALGICAGGGYTLHAAQTDVRIRAAATVSAVDSGRTRREGIGGVMTDLSRAEALEAVAKQRTLEAAGGPVKWVHYVAEPGEVPEDAPARSLAREATEYCRIRGAHPRSPNLYRFTSIARLFAYTAFDHLDWISPRPVLLIAGSDADTRYLSEDAFAMARDPKELFLVQGASHIDLYDRDPCVGEAVEKLAGFFREALGGTAEAVRDSER
ncbi:alpha/beta hydrolase [Sutterella sp.]|uniref:alpha/beta hydrolase n=1 Tax=Sutterella sp. TaxID=1981025 RepID=UPI0026DF00D6|nr:alpha/beta hydrolase [Sutterella sp.]MDO5531503.1 alpha/beta hydrolase [Sutterella sp.]